MIHCANVIIIDGTIAFLYWFATTMAKRRPATTSHQAPATFHNHHCIKCESVFTNRNPVAEARTSTHACGIAHVTVIFAGLENLGCCPTPSTSATGSYLWPVHFTDTGIEVIAQIICFDMEISSSAASINIILKKCSQKYFPKLKDHSQLHTGNSL